MMMRTLLASLNLFASVAAFTTPASPNIRSTISSSAASSIFLSSTATESIDVEISEAKEFLCRAARTKLENPDRVLDALNSLERNCKAKFRQDSAAFSADIMDNISGEWRLIFTTGTKERQAKTGGRVNYFPLKAIQKFDANTEPKFIENGIYGKCCIFFVRAP